MRNICIIFFLYTYFVSVLSSNITNIADIRPRWVEVTREITHPISKGIKLKCVLYDTRLESFVESVEYDQKLYIYSPRYGYLSKLFCEEGVGGLTIRGERECTVRLGWIEGEGKFYCSLKKQKDEVEGIFDSFDFEIEDLELMSWKNAGRTWIQFLVSFLLCFIGLVIPAILLIYILLKDQGNKEMKRVAYSIRQGSYRFLLIQYFAVFIVAILTSVVIYLLYLMRPEAESGASISRFLYGLIVSASFLFGVFCSSSSGILSMVIAVQTNVRVTSAATRSYGESFRVALFGGTFVSYVVNTICLAGMLFLLILIFGCFPKKMVCALQTVDLMVGFGFGASFASLFAQLGGGIFTKGADMGADLVGKHQNSLLEDDMRNPAVIADLVGDNVGDCAGRGSDLVETVAANVLAVMILGVSLANKAYPQVDAGRVYDFLMYPMLSLATGLVACFFGIISMTIVSYCARFGHDAPDGVMRQKESESESEESEEEESEESDSEEESEESDSEEEEGEGGDENKVSEKKNEEKDEKGDEEDEFLKIENEGEEENDEEMVQVEEEAVVEEETCEIRNRFDNHQQVTNISKENDNESREKLNQDNEVIAKNDEKANIMNEFPFHDVEKYVEETDDDESSDSDEKKRPKKKLCKILTHPVSLIMIGFTVTFFFCVMAMVIVNIWCFYGVGESQTWVMFTLCGVIGIAISNCIAISTFFFTDYSFPPTKSLARASEVGGAANNIIVGIWIGMISNLPNTFVIVIGLLSSYWIGKCAGFYDENEKNIGGIYGVASSTLGMLATSSFVLALDTFGPIADNAGGIAEMTGLHESVREITDKLDAVGNSVKALTKGYAMASAALASSLVIFAFMDMVSTYIQKDFDMINLAEPEMFVSGLIGAVVVFSFVAISLKSVSIVAMKVMKEVKRQYKKNPQILEGKVLPNYKKCVQKCTIFSLIYMLPPGLIGTFSPIIVGFFFRLIGFIYYKQDPDEDDGLLGVKCGTAFLIVSTITNVLMGTFLSNSGGAWDNAKKYVETGKHGGRNSETHKAVVIGDVVGDPFKDTAGPSLGILITLVATLTLVFGPLWIESRIIV